MSLIKVLWSCLLKAFFKSHTWLPGLLEGLSDPDYIRWNWPSQWGSEIWTVPLSLHIVWSLSCVRLIYSASQSRMLPYILTKTPYSMAHSEGHFFVWIIDLKNLPTSSNFYSIRRGLKVFLLICLPLLHKHKLPLLIFLISYIAPYFCNPNLPHRLLHPNRSPDTSHI